MTEGKEEQHDTIRESLRGGTPPASTGAQAAAPVPSADARPKGSGGLAEGLQFAVMSGLVTGLVLWFATPRLETPLILLFIPCYVVFIAWLKLHWWQIVAIVFALVVFTYYEDILFQMESGDAPDKVGVDVAVAGVHYAGQGRQAQVSVNLSLKNNRAVPIEFDRVLVRTRSSIWVQHDLDIPMPSTRLDPGASVNIPVSFIGSWRLNRAWVKIYRTGPDQEPIANVRVVIPDR